MIESMLFANKSKASVELIMRANNMDSIMLQPGDKLLIPRLSISMVIDRKAERLALYNNDHFFKHYKVKAFHPPAARMTTKVTTKVSDKASFKDGKRVAFGSKEYIGA